MRSIVEFSRVTRAYGSRLALDDVSLALEPGELTFLVGPSGAGKTTLLKLINRELRPTEGEVWVDGIATHKLKPSRISELRRRVGVVFQNYKLLPRLTAMENVALALQVTNLRVSDEEARERSLDALEAVGLGDRGSSFPDQLSGGQQQRVAVARAVVGQPPLLIADEPTGNLDATAAIEILDLLEQLNVQFGKTIIMVTHDPRSARRAHRLLHLDKGTFDERQIDALEAAS